MKANVITFENLMPLIYDHLPPPKERYGQWPNKLTKDDFKRAPVLLKLNHSDYHDIEISWENMSKYLEDIPFVGVEYKASITNKTPEGLSVYNNEEEDGTEEGDCPFIVHGLTGEKLESMTTSQIKGRGMMHLDNNGKVLAVGQEDRPESIWNNIQLYSKMFPWLFPCGKGGIGSIRMSDEKHKSFLMIPQSFEIHGKKNGRRQVD
ncbi:hypothetical protein ARMGADRAFT_1047107 [Armillaria gallica]|uniref:Uncharacterized protein n=1 Tax=Armillaria gallica TaxID=47427 RepID=A0A2H3D5T5_ARMGA|nr:hypothetical protein ARMGADRAFT_1047341 [Armillaria gallica]PBK89460.1 hypothetical protein ARMGADRAFT_1047107 [Armillaria gallica]